MGILNCTPDSFYDGGLNSPKINFLLKKNKKIDIVDIGAESTKPGAKPITAQEEIDRLEPYLYLIEKYKHIYFSIDTYKTEVAEYALKKGFHIINDIRGGGNEHQMIDLAKKYNSYIIIMHMKGAPETMQNNISYNDLINDILFFFNDKIKYSKKIGFNKLILDPGIGFGKTARDNFLIIKNIHKFKKLGYPLLIGISRKTFLSIDDDKPNERLISSLIMESISLINGADILRVHDINETKNMITLINKYIDA